VRIINARLRRLDEEVKKDQIAKKLISKGQPLSASTGTGQRGRPPKQTTLKTFKLVRGNKKGNKKSEPTELAEIISPNLLIIRKSDLILEQLQIKTKVLENEVMENNGEEKILS
jgi:hypothetical protein